MPCPICHERKAKRFCPAEGEKICAICCGTGREVTIDCPSDCAYLIAARRYEREHRQPIPRDQMPFPDIRVGYDSNDQQEQLVMLLAAAVSAAARELRATDDDVVIGLTALAEAYRTLQAGIYYEHPPEGPLPREIYVRAAKSLTDVKNAQTERAGFPSFKDSDALVALVFLLRVAKRESNGRLRSRAFLDFLRSWLPEEKAQSEPSRIITA